MCINNNENISCRTQTGDDFVILCPEYIINNNSKESSLQHYNAKFGNIVQRTETVSRYQMIRANGSVEY